MGEGKTRDVSFYRRLLERKAVELRSLATRMPRSAVVLRKTAKSCEEAARSQRFSLDQLRAVS